MIAEPESVEPLLTSGDPPAVLCINESGRSPYLLLCDHASNAVPARLESLGLAPEPLGRHIAFDLGAFDLAVLLSRRLDAPLLATGYSRLVIDANRCPDSVDSIPRVSDGVTVPGNQRISPEERECRIRELFAPYHGAIAELLDRRGAQNRDTMLVAVHSFTPVLAGRERPWHIGITYGTVTRIAASLIRRLEARGGLCIGDNQPYSVSRETDYTVPVHGDDRRLPAVLVEVRQDGLRDEASTRAWAELLGEALRAVQAVDREKGGSS